MYDTHADPIVAWFDIEIERRRNGMGKIRERIIYLEELLPQVEQELFDLQNARDVFVNPVSLSLSPSTSAS